MENAPLLDKSRITRPKCVFNHFPGVAELSPERWQILVEKGSVLNLKKRAVSKQICRLISGSLLYMGSPLHKQYQRAYYCSHILSQKDKKITSRYCDTRICNICNRIRTAKLINGYVGQLRELGSLQFVTLTRKNCKVEELKSVCEQMVKISTNILKKFRGYKKLSVNGIRKLEVTYNLTMDNYHPHIHILLDNDLGEDFIKEWLKRCPEAKEYGINPKTKKRERIQDCRLADSGSLMELFKYTTKINNGGKKGSIKIVIPALDKIMCALDGRRTIQPFGRVRFVKEEIINLTTVEYEDLPNYQTVDWVWNDNDWFAYDQALTGNEKTVDNIQIIY